MLIPECPKGLSVFFQTVNFNIANICVTQLEQMSQEDLLKYSKKQMLLLQKLKAKCDDLQSKHREQADYCEVRSH